MNALRSRVDLVRQFADEAGLSYGYAYQYMKGLCADDAAWEELDARLRARAALADLQAARSITEADVGAFVDGSDDPEADLGFLIRLRSHRLLNDGSIL